MPFYDYKCVKCSKIFEISKGMNENMKVSCPFCFSKETQRIFNLFVKLSGNNSFNDSGHNLNKTPQSGCSNCASNTCSSCSC